MQRVVDFGGDLIDDMRRGSAVASVASVCAIAPTVCSRFMYVMSACRGWKEMESTAISRRALERQFRDGADGELLDGIVDAVDEDPIEHEAPGTPPPRAARRPPPPRR